MTVKEYRNLSWVDLSTNGWMAKEMTSGKPWKELPEDYMVPAGGFAPDNFCIIVGGGDEEVSHQLSSPRFFVDPYFSIDKWR